MWQDEVKARLQAERQRWLEERDEDGADVQILSVTQLLRLLDAELSPAELLDQHGITRYDVSVVSAKKRRQSLKRPRTEERVDGQRAVSYASSCVWITGFVRHDQARAKKVGSALCLGDASSHIPVHIIDPAIEILDGLILVKEWTVVEHHIDALVQPHRLVEVRGTPLLLHQPMANQSLRYEDARAILRQHFPAQDPPMYAGSLSWEVARAGSDTNTIAAKRSSKTSKRKTHAVLGRISTVSPVSVQANSSNSHYFVEVEDPSSSHAERSLVNVLLAGECVVKWYSFLWPGLFVLITNLKKVYYADSGMFLLQASVGEHPTGEQSSLFVWRMPTDPIQLCDRALSRLEGAKRWLSGLTVDLEGAVTAINWDECLLVDSHPPAFVAMFHFPWSHMKSSLRVGCRIRIHHAHILSERSSDSGRVVLGLCSRGHVRLVEHAPAGSPPSKHRNGDQRRRLQKKWSIFGDFSRQSLLISTWWLDLLENLVQKFDFNSDATDKMITCSICFTCCGRREAALQIGQDLLSASRCGAMSSVSTLGQRFLNTHLEDSRDCPSIARNTDSAAFIGSRVPTLRNLGEFIQESAKETIALATSRGENLQWPLLVETSALSGLVAVGILRGCANLGDLEIIDNTAAIPILVTGNTSSVSLDSGCAVYGFKGFSAIVEKREDKPAEGKPSNSELAVTLKVCADDMQRCSLCLGCSTLTKPEHVSEDRCCFVLFVTEIDAWRRRSKLRSVVNEFRRVSGLGFRQTTTSGNSIEWSSAHHVEMLVRVDSEVWFIQEFSWLKVQGARVNASVTRPLSDCILVHWCRNMLSDAGISTGNVSSLGGTLESKALKVELAEAVTYVADSFSSLVPLALSSVAPNLVEADVLAPLNEVSHRWVTLLEEHAQEIQRAYAVRDLFILDFPGEQVERASTAEGIQSNPHSARLINLRGVIVERSLYTKIEAFRVNQLSGSSYDSPVDKANATKKSRMCRLKVRDAKSLEAVFVTFNQDMFGYHSSLQPGTLVELAGIQCFIARATFKPFLTWTHRTTARRIQFSDVITPSDGRLYTEMEDSFLRRLYNTNTVDRTIKRYVVRLAHVSYVLLKRKCSQCKQSLSLIKRQGTWMHELPQGEDVSSATQPRCSWKQVHLESADFTQKTFLASSLRCIVDDGSAQAELFIENEVVWELLRCSRGQRKRFEDLLVRQTSELSYFAARSASDSLFTSPSAQENLYYQNEWRAFILSTVESLGSLVVFAQRFYKNQAQKPAQLSVLSFGKDIQITVPSVPLVQLEAIRVDEVDARHELRRLLRRR